MWNRVKRGIRTRLIKRFGSLAAKKRLWDEEFAGGQWAYLERTQEDPIYSYLEKHLRAGSILDLGCGSGNTGSELDYSKYKKYTGVDVSEVAVEKARARATSDQRQAKNQYVCSDIENYVPGSAYDLILFRESIFYIALHRIKRTLDHYGKYLKPGGLILVRMHDREKYSGIVKLIVKNYSIADHYEVAGTKGIIIAFSPKPAEAE
jgi:SAM-dependent methyltransferase